MNNTHTGKWELGCIIFNSLVFKLFSVYPNIYVSLGGSAAWHSAIYCGVAFLILLFIILKFYTPYAKDELYVTLQKKNKTYLCYGFKIIFSLYFIISGIMSAEEICMALKETAFPNSPMWYIGLFLVIPGFIATMCGRRAVFRMHSLWVLGIGVTLCLVALLGFRYADIYNITPVFGKGVYNLYVKGLLGLFMYSDIFVIFFIPYSGSEKSYKKTVMTSGALAVLANVLILLSFSLNFPYELAEKTNLVVYPLTKGASVGKFPMRLDIAYLLSLISSGILYLSLCIHILKNLLKRVRVKKVGATIVCVLLCFSLCGCYDSSEVEERAYVIALGIDKANDLGYKYTFQISNPLESGGGIGGVINDEEEKKNSENKTVDNITVEAEDFYTAKTRLQAYLSKESDMSHIKLIVFSKAVASEDTLSHSSLLLNEREVRPATNICLAESANDFLLGVTPTLEESTVRYYELLFRKEEMPYAPVTELRDFVGRCENGGFDAVAPIYDKNGLWGMGIFNKGRLQSVFGGNDVLIYNMLSGQLNNVGIFDGGDGAMIESDGKPHIKVNTDGDIPFISINVKLKIKGSENPKEVSDMLKSRCEEFLKRTASDRCDVMGFGRCIKARHLTQQEWESIKWNEKYKNAVFFVRVSANSIKI